MNHSLLLTGPGGETAPSLNCSSENCVGGHHRGTVTLNVGGMVFQTRREALLRHPGTRLGECF